MVVGKLPKMQSHPTLDRSPRMETTLFCVWQDGAVCERGLE